MTMEHDHFSAAMRVSAELHTELDHVVCDLYSKIAQYCDSPIEAMLGTALIATFKVGLLNTDGVFCVFCPNGEVNEKKVWSIVPQLPWKGYRIDWAIFEASTKQPWQPWIFIECDGHEFHERTKEQAQRDREKDRTIQASGIPILRFTGSEIFRDAGRSCTLEIIKFLGCR